MKKYSKVSLLIFTDIIFINLAFILALLLRFDFNVDSQEFSRYLSIYQNWAIFITLIKITVNIVMGLYNSLWEYASIDEVFRVTIAAAFNFALVIMMLYYVQQLLPRSTYLMVFILDIVFLGGTRIFYRALRRLRNSEDGRQFVRRINLKNAVAPTDTRSRVLIIGAGQAGAAIIRELQGNPRSGKQVIGVIDDDPAKIGTRIMGKKVYGSRDSIPWIVKKRDIHEIIIAIPSASKKEIRAIANICEKTGCKTSILPGYIDLIDGKVSIAKLRKVNFEDLFRTGAGIAGY